MARLLKIGQALWEYLREVSGENDYPRYRTRVLAQKDQPMTPQEFYLWHLRQKYSRLNRCC